MGALTKTEQQDVDELGNMFRQGIAVKQGYTEANMWYLKAENQGISGAPLSLANTCYQGRGAKQHSTEAVKWWRKAADQGLPNGQVMLTQAYEHGLGLATSLPKALEMCLRL